MKTKQPPIRLYDVPLEWFCDAHLKREHNMLHRVGALVADVALKRRSADESREELLLALQESRIYLLDDIPTKHQGYITEKSRRAGNVPYRHLTPFVESGVWKPMVASCHIIMLRREPDKFLEKVNTDRTDLWAECTKCAARIENWIGRK